jgi:hypothetical protein
MQLLICTTIVRFGAPQTQTASESGLAPDKRALLSSKAAVGRKGVERCDHGSEKIIEMRFRMESLYFNLFEFISMF